MTRDEAMAVLKKAFAALSDEQRANLRDAAEKERRICCKLFAYDFTRADGSG